MVMKIKYQKDWIYNMSTIVIMVFTAVITYYVTLLSVAFDTANGSHKNIINCSIGNSNNNLQINRINSSNITINGKSYTGKNITSKDDIVYVDGKETEKYNNASINIEIHGEVGSVDVGIGDVKITGDVKESIKTSQGDIECGSVGGNVISSMGNINVVGNIMGSTKTSMGNITYTK